MAKSQVISLWFDHFTHNDLRQFQFGSKALAQYALRKREEVCAALHVSMTVMIVHIGSLARLTQTINHYQCHVGLGFIGLE